MLRDGYRHSPLDYEAIREAAAEIERLRKALEEFAKPEMWARQVLDGTLATIWTGADYGPEDFAREALSHTGAKPPEQMGR
jgi:hypothetical protein